MLRDMIRELSIHFQPWFILFGGGGGAIESHNKKLTRYGNLAERNGTESTHRHLLKSRREYQLAIRN